MCEIQDYLKSLNPKDNEKDILIFGKKYKLWRDGKYIGIAIWTQDENVGDSFQTISEDGICQVYIADTWELIIKPPYG